MKIISISGLDGSGKSTQIQRLKNYFEESGNSVYYFHAIQFSLANRILSTIKKFISKNSLSRDNKDKDSTEKSVTSSNWLLIQIRKIFLIIDIYRFKKMIGDKKYDVVLTDRYFYDTVININFLSDSNNIIFAEKFIPVPNYPIYLSVDPAMIMQRKRVPEQGIEYLRKKRDLFEECVDRWKMITIDGNVPEDNVFQSLLNEITKDHS